MTQATHQLIRDFFAAMPSGHIPDALLTSDMTGWSTLQGPMNKAAYLGCVKMLGVMFSAPLEFALKAITVEDDRAVAEAESTGQLINGEEYRNTYVFVFRVRDGRIASVAEHFNAIVVRDKLLPVMKLIAANK